MIFNPMSYTGFIIYCDSYATCPEKPPSIDGGPYLPGGQYLAEGANSMSGISMQEFQCQNSIQVFNAGISMPEFQ